MYVATLSGSCDDECAGLGDYGSFGYDDPFSSPYSFDLGLPGGDPFDPMGNAYSFDVGGALGSIWSGVKDILGDAAEELGPRVVDWIQRRIGVEAWERLPDASRRAAVEEAVRSTEFATSVIPVVAIGLLGVVVLLKVLG